MEETQKEDPAIDKMMQHVSEQVGSAMNRNNITRYQIRKRMSAPGKGLNGNHTIDGIVAGKCVGQLRTFLLMLDACGLTIEVKENDPLAQDRVS
jgi:hypothetical protein